MLTTFYLQHKKVGKNEYVGDLPVLTMPVKIFLSNLIMSQNSKELLRKSAKQVLTARSDPSKPVVNTATILNTIKDRRKNLPRTAKSSLPVIIPDPQKTEYDIKRLNRVAFFILYFYFIDQRKEQNKF